MREWGSSSAAHLAITLFHGLSGFFLSSGGPPRSIFRPPPPFATLLGVVERVGGRELRPRQGAPSPSPLAIYFPHRLIVLVHAAYICANIRCHSLISHYYNLMLWENSRVRRRRRRHDFPRFYVWRLFEVQPLRDVMWNSEESSNTRRDTKLARWSLIARMHSQYTPLFGAVKELNDWTQCGIVNDYRKASGCDRIHEENPHSLFLFE